MNLLMRASPLALAKSIYYCFLIYGDDTPVPVSFSLRCFYFIFVFVMLFLYFFCYYKFLQN